MVVEVRHDDRQLCAELKQLLVVRVGHHQVVVGHAVSNRIIANERIDDGLEEREGLWVLTAYQLSKYINTYLPPMQTCEVLQPQVVFRLDVLCREGNSCDKAYGTLTRADVEMARQACEQ